jgi:hypothetical protein
MLTIVVKDGNGKTYTVLRCLMPHERCWIFCWLFKILLPTLLGRDNLKRVNVVITDGDTQETAVLDDWIDTLFLPNGAVRDRCLWHAVNYKMKQSVLGYFQVGNDEEKAQKKLVYEDIVRWIQSWASEDCETYQEYVLSKFLLERFCKDQATVRVIGQAAASAVIKFVRHSIQPIESNYCLYPRSDLVHLDACMHKLSKRGQQSRNEVQLLSSPGQSRET